MRFRSAVVAILAAVTAGVRAQAPAQDGQAQRQPPVFRAGVNVVRVDAVVTTREGAPLLDLKQEDFEVSEDGKRQDISTFSLMQLDGGLIPDIDGNPVSISSDEVEQQEAAREDVRLFTIFLDDYHVTRESGRIVREQVARFIETQLGPTDMVGIMYPLTPLSAIRMTRKHDDVIRIVRQFEGRRGDYAPKNAIEEGYVYRMGMGVSIEEIRNEVVFSALNALALRMGGMKEGRQTIVLVGEGFVSASRDKLYGFLNDVARNAARSNTAIYPVNPQILAPGIRWMPGSALDTLNYLAIHTGGRAIVDQTKTGAEYRERYAVAELPSSRLTMAMKQIVSDASVYYLIGYNSPIAPDDKFHRIQVKVKRRNVELRHREGYIARKTP